VKNLIKLLVLSLIVLLNFACSVNTPSQLSYKQKIYNVVDIKKTNNIEESYNIIDTKKIKTKKPEAILKLDTKGHTARISRILVTKDKDIITSSIDKTIRIWDSNTGKLKRQILGEIGDASYGEINDIALSIDEKYLAVVGWLNSEFDKKHSIRIYDYKSGKLVKVLNSHTSIIANVSFSKDGKYLISASTDMSVKIWNVKNNFSLQDTIVFKKFMKSAKIINYKDKDFALITASNQIVLYDIDNRVIKNIYRANSLLRDTDYNGKDIAVSTNTYKLIIMDIHLNVIKVIKSKAMPSGLAYSPDKKSLIVGASRFPTVNIYDASKNYKKISSFSGFKNMSFEVNFMDNHTAISADANSKDIYLWDIYTNKIKKKISGVGKAIWSVDIDGDIIKWGNVVDFNHHPLLQKSMNLKNFRISSIQPKVKTNIPIVNGRYSLSSTTGAILNIKKDGAIVASITRGRSSGYVHRCYGWYKDYIVSGANNGNLDIYNKQGIHLASLVGHTGVIWSIGLDGDKLISGSDDQTMMIWDLSKVETLHKKLQLNMDRIKYYMKRYNASQEYIIHACQQVGIDDIYLKSHVKPIVKIFVTKDNEYVVWTDDGFFDASKKGTQYVGYHINQGVYKEAEYISVDALYSTFYRPDLIQKALKSQSLKKYAKNINIAALLRNGLAPEVNILTKIKKTKKEELSLKVQVCPKGMGGFDNLTLMINNTPVSVIDRSRALKLKKRFSRDGCFIYNKTISLIGGINNIGFKATNRAGNIESKPDFLQVTFDDSNLKRKLRSRLSGVVKNQNMNDLHILAIAVNNYKDKQLNLKSINDATEMLNTIKHVAKPLFHKVHIYKLFDKDVTKQKITKAFHKIRSTRNDVFLLYIAGHGITDEYNGNYYYIPYDFRNIGDNLAVQNQGIGQKDLMLGLSSITALKSLVLLDTCNSGSFVEADMQKTTTNKLAKAIGRATISASSKSQVALEGFKGHGVFTYTLLEALNGKGYGRNNKITINELSDYVEDILPSRTYHKWGYKQIPQSSMYGTDFNIGIKK